MSEQQIVQVTAEKISTLTGYSLEEVAIVKNTVAKNTTNTELAYFLNVAKSIKLNPFNKEIWCYKNNKGNVLVFAGRDGFLKKAQESKLWNGMTSFEVCEKDLFEIDIAQQQVNHKPNFKDRGQIIGAYAIVKPKGCELATIEWADFATYNKGLFTWKSHPADMIKKCAETKALKKAFGISGLQSEFEYDINNDIAQKIDTGKTKNEIIIDKLISNLDSYEGNDRDELKRQCAEKVAKGDFTKEFAESIFNKIGAKL